MSELPLPPTPRWAINWMGACAFAGAIFAACTVALAFANDHILPPPTSPIIMLALSTAFVAVLIVGTAHRLVAHFNATVHGVAHRMDRRMEILGNGMIEHGIQLDTITGEIPKARPLIVACTHGPVQGRATVPAGLDPDVMRAASRLQGRVIPIDR